MRWSGFAVEIELSWKSVAVDVRGGVDGEGMSWCGCGVYSCWDTSTGSQLYWKSPPSWPPPHLALNHVVNHILSIVLDD